MNLWWKTLAFRARLGLVLGAAGILLVTALAGSLLLRRDDAVLFSDLRAQDAAVFAAELDKQKIPYAVADDGSTLLVERAQVHATRLKLLGKDLPLHGSVGFELFNQADFGMTEFAQKINYQRALQGELTRTIQAFPEVRDARVHLALPEQGLFRQASAGAKAAITLALRPGQALRREQVQGIQRLVAAAVPGLVAQEVTIVDQHGVALSRPEAGDEQAAGSHALDLKRETEHHLSRKAGAVLEQALGPGQALASVDVTLDMDRVRVSTEEVIAAPDLRGGSATGVLVRERESARDSSGPEGQGAAASQQRGSSVQRELEYQTGRRSEQVVSQPGAIRRIQVVAVLRQALPPAQQDQLRSLVAAAVGAVPARGDTVVVQSFERAPVALPAEPPVADPVATPRAGRPALAPEVFTGAAIAVALLLSLGLVVRQIAVLRRRARAAAASLDGEQRQLALRRVEAWLQEADAPASGPLAGQGVMS